jgi:integrase
MAGTVKHERKIESPSARSRLKWRRQPYWQQIESRAHLGFRKWKRQRHDVGEWLLRRYVGGGRYRVEALGRADDHDKADGTAVLSFAQARSKARAMVGGGGGAIQRLTVRQAVEHYIEAKAAAGQPVRDLISRTSVHVLPTLGDLAAAELTTETLRKWLAAMAAAPAQKRPKGGEPQFYAEPGGDEAIRRRRSSANRVLGMLRGALNHAFREGRVATDVAWRRVAPFRGVGAARVRYLSIAEAQRLLNACDADFRALVRAALETGARYGELARLEVADFNPDASTIAIRKSKTSRARHVILTPEGAAFFAGICAGRGGHELMFRRADGRPWQRSAQFIPMREAVKRAKITPPISFHALRHTWASLAVMNGVPLMVVAKVLGHTSTRMVEAHYGHLASSYITDEIHRGAPRFGGGEETGVVPLHRPQRRP